METDGDSHTIETGEEMLVVTALHACGTTRMVGVFTSPQLANASGRAYSSEYGKNGETSFGPVVNYCMVSACLNQHGICPELQIVAA
jgi:hypothetical protein